MIVVGSVRRHRHPERYGRHTGRPRESRGKGIARAMLETIPIIKFGCQDGGAPHVAYRDVENASEDPTCTPTEHGASGPNAEANKEGQSSIDSGNRNQPPAPDAGNSCPICADDFVMGQDLRLLPCNHTFHPGCVDPWLMNLSATCPVW